MQAFEREREREREITWIAPLEVYIVGKMIVHYLLKWQMLATFFPTM